MKVLPKLIAFCCAVCMVGMVWGVEDYEMYVFKKAEKWNIARLYSDELLRAYSTITLPMLPKDAVSIKIASDIPAKEEKIALYTISKPTDNYIEIDDSKEKYDKINKEQSKLLFTKNDGGQTPLDLIKEALKKYDKKGEKKEGGEKEEETTNYNMYVFKENNEWKFVILNNGICVRSESLAAQQITNPKEIKSYISENLPTPEKYSIFFVSNKPTGAENIPVNSDKNEYVKIVGDEENLQNDMLFGQHLKDGKALIDLIKEALKDYDKTLGKKGTETTPTETGTGATNKPGKETGKESITPPLSVPQTDQSILDLTKALRDLYFGKVK